MKIQKESERERKREREKGNSDRKRERERLNSNLPLEVEVHVGDAGKHHGDVDLDGGRGVLITRGNQPALIATTLSEAPETCNFIF